MSRRLWAGLAALLALLGLVLPRPPWPGAGSDDKARETVCLRILALAMLAGIIIPSTGCPLAREDRVLHAVLSADACCTASGVARHCDAGGGSPEAAGAAFALGLGVAKEIWDSRDGGGADAWDLLADMAGAAAGYALAWHFKAED